MIIRLAILLLLVVWPTALLADDLAAKKVYVFVCDNERNYVVEASSEMAWLFAPDGTRKLVAHKGLEPGVFGDDVYNLQIVNQQATLVKQDGLVLSCRNDARLASWERSKLGGADFRAVGNEPPWSLEIHEGQLIILRMGYDNKRYEFRKAKLLTDRSARVSRWQAAGLELTVIGEECHDSMSEDSYETKVVVCWNGEKLQGCGRALH